MGWKFNPFTVALDQTGSTPSSYIDGEVSAYNDLPLSSTTAPLDSAWLVRGSSGVWPFTKPGGVYIRTATGGSSRDADYTYAGVFPDVFSDANFTLYDDADTSKNLKFQLSGISTGATRTLTAPNASGRLQIEGQPIGNTTPSTGAFTSLSATGAITAAAGTAGTPTALPTALGVQWSNLGGSDIAAVYGTYSGAGKVGIGVGTTGVLAEVASFALAGIAFNRSLTATNGTLTASAPVLDLSQTWNNAAVTFTTLKVNVTNTASTPTSLLQDWQVGGASVANIRIDGRATFTTMSASSQIIGPQGATVGTTSDCAISVGASNTGFVVSSNQLTAVKGGVNVWYANNSSALVVAASMTNGLTIENTGSPLNLSRNISLFPDATGTLVQRSGTTAQSYLLNGTYTSSTNYQRLAIRTKVTTLPTLSGASVVTTGGFIPDGAVLVGLTTRVSTAITGATGYDIGDGTDPDRWGANIGAALNTSSDNINWTANTIQCFTAAQEVTLTAVGSNFTGGAVQIVAHYLAGEAD